jgi:hypothetical protein
MPTIILYSELMRDPLVLPTPAKHRLTAPGTALKEGHGFREMLAACRRNRTEMSPVFESELLRAIFIGKSVDAIRHCRMPVCEVRTERSTLILTLELLPPRQIR